MARDHVHVQALYVTSLLIHLQLWRLLMHNHQRSFPQIMYETHALMCHSCHESPIIGDQAPILVFLLKDNEGKVTTWRWARLDVAWVKKIFELVLNLKEVKQHARELERTTLRVKSMECLIVLNIACRRQPNRGSKNINKLINQWKCIKGRGLHIITKDH